MNISEFFEKSPKYIGLTGSVGLLVSIVYDWGCFTALGINFSEAPTSISDHLRSGLIWTTYLLPIFLGSLAFGLLTRRIEKGMTEDEIVNSSSTPKFTKKFRNSANIATATLLAIFACSFMLFGDIGHPFITAIACALLWQLFIEWVLREERLANKLSVALKFGIYLGPTIAILAFTFGLTNTSREIKRTDIKIFIHDATSSDKTCASYSRAFSQGLLAVTCNGQLQFFNWSAIKKIERTQPVDPFNGLLCNLSPQICSKPTNTVTEQKKQP